MTAIERRQAILQVLCARRQEIIENLCFEFGVSRSTLKRDILELSLSYPIFTTTGRYHGGVYVADDYYYGKQYLSKEQQDLIISLQSAVDDDQRKILESIVKKFGRVHKEDKC